jgi:regulation of enolase protein 1 (concanavalin A-like superfamily)
MDWLNEAPRWQADGDTLRVTTAHDTDFWQVTHYGFEHDNGHLYYQTVAGDFEATVTIRGAYTDQYDQAGIMLRLDAKHWLKAGIEYVDGLQNVSCVVTRDFSDWSVVPQQQAPDALRLHITRQADFVEVRYAFGVGEFRMLRLAYFPPGVPVQVGPICCSPLGPGFDVTFEDFTVRPLAPSAQ